eukprot:c445_g1_i1.p1 GENE.c445_g1_i1~~c445_g1_i1.p1  ORF type:complete len:123 (-),score=8.84 c445_g1_i1:65-433(-)
MTELKKPLNTNDITEQIKTLQIEIEGLKQFQKLIGYEQKFDVSIIFLLLNLVLIYVAISVYLMSADVNRPWEVSIVPSVVFIISTWIVQLLKRFYTQHLIKKENLSLTAIRRDVLRTRTDFT